MSTPIRVLSIMEAAFVTGPAKNLLEFAVRSRPEVDLTAATYQRGEIAEAEKNPFVISARQRHVPMEIISERGRFDPSVIASITALLDRLQPDIVQTHNVKTHFLLRYSGLYRRYRWLAFHHGYVTTDLKMRLYNQLDRWSLPRALGLVTVCGPFRDQLVGRGIESGRIIVRHNAVQPFERPPEAVLASADVPRDMPLLVQIGRLSHEKGHLDLLAALASLRALRWHLVIVGEGPERNAIERAVASLGLQDRVTLAGHQNDVRPYLAMARIFVMPSHSEGSPNAMLEAMSAGVPVVASAVGGIPELVLDGYSALLGPARDPGHLASRLERLLGDPALAATLSRNALDKTRQLDYCNYRTSLLELYGRVLALPPGAQLR